MRMRFLEGVNPFGNLLSSRDIISFILMAHSAKMHIYFHHQEKLAMILHYQESEDDIKT
jgi:hypothetical protein